MRFTNQQPTRRAGLTLIEMLVAMALAIFLMAILSEAFVVGLKSFRTLKAAGDMDQQLRQASTILRRDLAANHFEGDLRLRELIPGNAAMGYLQVGEGFVTVGPSSFPGTAEGGDIYSIGVTRDTNDWLSFTVRLNGNRPQDYFFGRVPVRPLVAADSPLDGYGYANSRFDFAPATYASQWAEITYFLRPDPLGLTTEGLTDPAGQPLPGLPIFQLFRRQRLLVPDGFAQGASNVLPGTGTTLQASPITDVPHHDGNSDVSAYQVAGTLNPLDPNNRWKFTSPADVQYPDGLKGPPGGPYQWDAGRRFRPITNPLLPAPGVVPQMVGFPRLNDLDPTATRWGGDLLLGNVVSFDVKVWDPFANRDPVTGIATGAFVDLGFGIPPTLVGGAWTATPRPAAPPFPAADHPRWRPLGNVPLNLAWTLANPLPVPNWDATQRLYTNAWVYDTWTRRIGGGSLLNPAGWSFWNPAAQQAPYPASIQAIQIQIRLWDRKTNQTRQVTIIQDM